MSKQFEALLSRVKAIEEARRDGQYRSMQTFAVRIVSRLTGSVALEVWKIRTYGHV